MQTWKQVPLVQIIKIKCNPMNDSKIYLEKAYAHCKQLTIEADSNFALSFRFLPKQKQDAIYAVYAFNRLADDFADETGKDCDPLTSLLRWEELLEDCYREKSSDHPVITAFADTIRQFNIPKKPFSDAIEGFKMDLSINRYRTFDDLKVYCERVAGTISTMSLHIFGWNNEKAFEYGTALSYALQLTNIIRDVSKDIEKNRIYIPLDEMDRFGYSEDDLRLRRKNENFLNLMNFQVERARNYFRQAEPLINAVSPDSRFTVVMIGSVYAYLLRKIVTKKIPVLDEVISLTGWEKLKVTVRMRLRPSFQL